MDQFLIGIRELGFQPSVLSETDLQELDQDSDPVSSDTPPRELTPLVMTAHDRAIQLGQLLLIDFHAVWCGPCKILEREVFKHADAQSTLEKLTVLKVDTDEHPDTARRFEVAGLPTLVVLDTDGREVYRHVGAISRTELLEALELLLVEVGRD